MTITDTLTDVQKKHLRVLVYLLVSGLLGFGLSWLMNKPELAVILTPAINYALFAIKQELDAEDYPSSQ